MPMQCTSLSTNNLAEWCAWPCSTAACTCALISGAISTSQRATHKAERLASAAGVRNWEEAHRAAKWSWAGHVARRPVTAWVWRVSTWRDSEWQTLVMEVGGVRPLRPSRRRWMQWGQDLHRFCSSRRHGYWMTFAQSRENWANAVDDFYSGRRQRSCSFTNQTST